MAEEVRDNSRNEVEIDLDKYMKLLNKLDDAEDKIKDLQDDLIKARARTGGRKFIDLFLDDNDINEKAIIGFISFGLMLVLEKNL